MQKSAKERIKEILKISGIYIILVSILILNIIIGANDKSLRILPLSILFIIAVAYLMLRKILLKERIIIKNTLDICVLIFMISTTLPYIFKTYSTFQGTVEFILKYFFVYAIYLVTRNTIESKKDISTIIIGTLICSIIPMFFGVYCTYKNQLGISNIYIDSILKTFNLEYILADNYRMTSTFGYANTLAIYMVFCNFIAIYQIENTKSKLIKLTYLLYIIPATIVIYYTYSRLPLLLYILGLGVFLGVKILEKIKRKKTIIITISIISVLIIGLIIYIQLIGLRYSDKREISYNEPINIGNKFKPNTTYELEFEFESECEENTEYIELSIIEMNRRFEKINLGKLKIEDFSKNAKINFKTSNDEVAYIMIYANENGKAFIKKFLVNGEERILKYKYLPYGIARVINTLSFKEASVFQRMDFYKDCLKIAKDNPIIGQGGNTWKYLSLAVQDYTYYIKETHSYFFELLISYGIIGVVAFILILIVLIINLIKERNKDNLPLVIALFTLIVHSLAFDFNMSFLVILMTVFIYIAVLNKNENKLSNNIFIKSIDYIMIIIFIYLAIVYVRADIAKYIINKDDYEKKFELCSYNADYRFVHSLNQKEDSNKYITEVQEFIDKEPYYMQSQIYKAYWERVIKQIDELSNEELKKYFEYGLNKLKTIRPAYSAEKTKKDERERTITYIVDELKAVNKDKEKNMLIQNTINELEKCLTDDSRWKNDYSRKQF